MFECDTLSWHGMVERDVLEHSEDTHAGSQVFHTQIMNHINRHLAQWINLDICTGGWFCKSQRKSQSFVWHNSPCCSCTWITVWRQLCAMCISYINVATWVSPVLENLGWCHMSASKWGTGASPALSNWPKHKCALSEPAGAIILTTRTVCLNIDDV